MIFLVVLVLSDQWPKIGPDRRPLKLNADRANPRKYGGASKVCKYLHTVGNITAGTQKNISLDKDAYPCTDELSAAIWW